MKILIFGKGSIGQRCADVWSDSVLSDVRMSSKEDALEEIRRHNPDAVLNAAGVTGKPNVDWCDVPGNQHHTVAGNTLLPIVLAQACHEAGVYLLHIGSGCIFYGDSPHPDKMWRENDFGNPAPTYSRAKWAADLVLSMLPNVGIARIRMPLDHIPGPRNLIDKLARYPKVIDVENSVTVVDDMLATFRALLERKGQGIFHVTNPGTMKHRELLGLYEELVDPSHKNEWITAEELVTTGLASKLRSNNFMHSSRLEELGIRMRSVKEALRDTMEKYAKAKRIPIE